MYDNCYLAIKSSQYARLAGYFTARRIKTRTYSPSPIKLYTFIKDAKKKHHSNSFVQSRIYFGTEIRIYEKKNLN